MTAAQLLITHGTTDLQILLRDEQGRLWRAAPDKNIVRRFHQWLLAQPDAVAVIDLPADLHGREREATFTNWNEETFALRLRNENPDVRPERTPEGRLQVVLPKITPALAEWLAHRQEAPAPQTEPATALGSALRKALAQDAPPLTGVLVLSTDRSTDEQEPVATFTFLKRWLTERRLAAEETIQEVCYLRPGEKLESTDSPIDPAVAERIEQAIRNSYDRQTRPTLLLATMGGLPAIKPLIAEIVQLIAGDRAQSLFKTEHGAQGLIPITPIDVLRVRRQCLEQVKRGAFLDAWALATPCHGYPDARPWLTPLQQAAALLNGNPVGQRAALPALQALLDHAKKAACLLVAIRVETALLTERWLEAINGSFTFLEAAFHDAINEWAKENLEEYDPRERYMRFKSSPPDILFAQIKDEGKPALQPWKGKKSGPLAFQANMVGENALTVWDEVLGNAALNALRKAFHTQIELANRRTYKLVNYRNFNTHGVMTQDEIDEAITRFMGSNLWSQGVNTPASRPKPGKCFLGRALITNVIRSLVGDEVQPVQLYTDLIEQISARLIDPTAVYA